LLPRLVSHAIVDVLVACEPLPWQRMLLERLCRRVEDADPHVPLSAEIVRTATRFSSDGVLTFSEFCVVPTAEACLLLGLPGPGEGAAQSRNKLLMRQAWERAGVPNPAFLPVDSADELAAARRALGGPVIVKSALGAGSIGQAILAVGSDATSAWHAIEAAELYARSRGLYEKGLFHGPRFIVEEIIQSTSEGWYEAPGYGDYLSVEGLVVGGVYHPICLTARLPTVPVFVELSNQAPCTLPEHLQHRIAEVCRRAVDALGLDTCATHTEVKLMLDGSVRMLESAARVGGAAVTRELVEVFGVDLLTLQLTAALGERPALPDRLQTGADARGAAASLSVIAADSTGRPWSALPPFVPDLVDWSELVSPGTTVELVKGVSQEPGSPLPRYHPNTGVLAHAGLLFLCAPDPLTLRADSVRVLDGLEEAMSRAWASVPRR
jgi:biotin carboxylase